MCHATIGTSTDHKLIVTVVFEQREVTGREPIVEVCFEILETHEDTIILDLLASVRRDTKIPIELSDDELSRVKSVATLFLEERWSGIILESVRTDQEEENYEYG